MRHLFTLVIFAFLLMSCNHQKTGDERTEEEYARLRIVTDAVHKQSPKARALLDSALVNTRDSLSYYDYYVEQGHLYLMEQPDSALLLSDRIMHFAKNAPQTPRTKGLLAQAYHLRSNYYYLSMMRR